MTDGRISCPRCGEDTPDSDECAHCGIVFTKFRDREAEALRGVGEQGSSAAPADSARAISSAPRATGQRRLAYLLVLLAFTLLGALAVDAMLGRRDRGELEAAALQARSIPAGPAFLMQPEEPTQRMAAPADTDPFEDPPLASFGPELPEPAVEPSRPRAVSSSYSWFEGAGGFVQGFEEAERDNKAVLVYFYTDWCPYCRQLDRDLLSRARVEETTKLFVKIKINPEAGPAERLLGDRYGVTGYPSLFAHAAGAGRPTKVRTMTERSGDWRTSSPEDFVEMLARTVGERFAGV